MKCLWSGQQAYGHALVDVTDEEHERFWQHLTECPRCRVAVDEAKEIDALLRAVVTPVEPPTALARRIAAQTALAKPPRRWLGFFAAPKLRLLSAAAALLLALGLFFGTLIAPSSMLALVREWLYFVPGIGMTAADDGTLVARGPVVVQTNGLTFTVLALLSNGKTTEVQFRLTGVPGGKEGWRDKPLPAAQPGPAPTVGPAPPQPFLRDTAGNTYKMTNGSFGVGGDQRENVITGEGNFEPLPKDLERIDLVMPIDWLVPAPAVDMPRELVASIALVSPALRELTPALALDEAATVNGITLRALSVAFTDEGTAVEIAAQPGGPQEQIVGMGGVLRHPRSWAILLDGRGRAYQPKEDSGGIVPRPYRQTLLFPDAKGERGDLSLRVDTLRAQHEGSVTFRIPLAGRRVGERFDLNTTLTLDGWQVRVLAGELSPEGDGAWLKLYLDLGPGANGRKLVSVEAASRQQHSFSMSYDQDTGQTSYVGVPVDVASAEAQITFSIPVVEVTGPWVVPLTPTSR